MSRAPRPVAVRQPMFSMTPEAAAGLLAPKPDVGHLQCWAEDLPYLEPTQVQADLVAWLLPAIVDAWSRAIDGDLAAVQFAWAWHRALARHPSLIRAAAGHAAEVDFVAELAHRLVAAAARSQAHDQLDLRFWPFWNCAAATWPQLIALVGQAWWAQAATEPAAALSAMGYLACWVFDPHENPTSGLGPRHPWDRVWLDAGPPPWPANTARQLRAWLGAPGRLAVLDHVALDDPWGAVVLDEVRQVAHQTLSARLDEGLRPLLDGRGDAWWASELGADRSQ